MTGLETLLHGYLLPIGGAFVLAWLVHRTARRLITPFVRLGTFAPGELKMRVGRQQTLHDLFSSAIGFVAFLLAGLFTLSFFVQPDTLVWMVGLFSAGLGFASRPIISDWLTGIGFIFEDTYDVGDKVEILEIQGVIEELNLRTTLLRAPTGELYIIPNGEIRVVRNFSRGKFSSSKIKLMVHSADLEKVLPLLHDLGEQAALELPELLEPWQVITAENFGQEVEVTLMIKARFGRAADLRPQVLTLIQHRLEEASITLAH